MSRELESASAAVAVRSRKVSWSATGRRAMPAERSSHAKCDWPWAGIRSAAMAFRVGPVSSGMAMGSRRVKEGRRGSAFLHCRIDARTDHSRPTFRLSSDPEGCR
jgi:hypothetical protein